MSKFYTPPIYYLCPLLMKLHKDYTARLKPHHKQTNQTIFLRESTGKVQNTQVIQNQSLFVYNPDVST